MVPPAPATFSTITWVLSEALMVWASSRATVSDGPPAENGTMMVITFEGYSAAFACAAPRKRKPHMSISKTLRIMAYLPARKSINNGRLF
jgi:hypothetical protein